jgi:hypothetical protein
LTENLEIVGAWAEVGGPPQPCANDRGGGPGPVSEYPATLTGVDPGGEPIASPAVAGAR